MRTFWYCVAALVLAASAGTALAVEVITLRSGQHLGSPGAVGDLDDTITYNPWGNPVREPVLGRVLVAADFAATAAGQHATIVLPHAAWMGGQTAPLSDPLARWINFGTLPSGEGTAGSALYAVPFFVNSTTIAIATLQIEGGVDDALGDGLGATNPDGLYINGIGSGLTSPPGFNFATPTTHFLDITDKIHPGQNYLYFNQRDAGAGYAGLIFRATIEVVPEPSSSGLAAMGTLFALGRRRRKAE
ncbi:MAG: PEP-CTERM sorting domain-containing protein [Tepidisphaeraceae bacterium]